MKYYVHTLVNVGMIGGIARIIEKPGVAIIAASKNTWPAMLRRIDHHSEGENAAGQDQARPEEI